MTSRRAFLKVGLAGAFVLAVARGMDRQVFAQAPTGGSLDLKKLANKDADCIAALAPAILNGALPADPAARLVAINEVVEAFDRTVAGLSPAIQKEVEQLLSLLTFAPTRRLVAGVSAPWHEATEADVSRFIEQWRQSRFSVLQQGYQALSQLMIACWYGNPLAWESIGYGGPPQARELGLL
ncbi:MAG: hypothetical protein ABI905_03810 [Betaproteobacteria bacterium]